MWRGLRTLPLVVQEEKDGQSEEWIGLNESQDVVDDRNAELDHVRRARGRRHDNGLLMFLCTGPFGVVVSLAVRGGATPPRGQLCVGRIASTRSAHRASKSRRSALSP